MGPVEKRPPKGPGEFFPQGASGIELKLGRGPAPATSEAWFALGSRGGLNLKGLLCYF